jgi:hypothetical protein
VIVYRDVAREEHTAAVLQRCRSQLRACDRSGLLVEVGQLEQGVADALCPVQEEVLPALDLIREGTCAAAAAYLGGDARPETVGAILDALENHRLPAHITVKAPEGYVQYALDPAGYAAAAREYTAAVGARYARRAVVLGVRSIGTSLSAVLAQALGAAPGFTLRPRGASGHKAVAASDTYVARLLEAAGAGGDVLIVDEGPGATGETFDCIAAWLRSLGVSDERIVLFGSRTWGMPLAPAARQAWFHAARKYAPPADEARPGRAARALGLVIERDLSGGRWREVVTGGHELPADPAHERSKYLCRGPRGRRVMLRYAGLGSWGDAARVRAERLAGAAIGPAVHGLEDGFLALDWVDGAALEAPFDDRDQAAESVRTYLARRAPLFRTGAPVEHGPIITMLRENAQEVLGEACAGLAGALRAIEALPEREAVVPDARMQPYEWVLSERGAIKVDALDHGDGIRLPGPTDLAWDTAGAWVELAAHSRTDPPAWLDRAIEEAAAAAGQEPDELRVAVDAYRPAYATLALGAATLASWEAGAPDEMGRHEREIARFRTALIAALERFS